MRSSFLLFRRFRTLISWLSRSLWVVLTLVSAGQIVRMLSVSWVKGIACRTSCCRRRVYVSAPPCMLIAHPAGVEWSAAAKMEALREKTRRKKREDDAAHARMTGVGPWLSC